MHSRLYTSKRSGASTASNGKDEEEEDGAGPTKKVRVSKERASQGIEKLQENLMKAFSTEDFKSVTNDVLKDYLKQKEAKGFSAKKKSDLIAMVRELLEKDKVI